MSADTIIFSALSASPAVTAIAGDREFPVAAQQSTQLPYVVWQRIGTTPVASHEGPSDLESSLVQVTCYAATYSEAYDLRNAVRSVLDSNNIGGASGAVGVLRDLRESSEIVDATEVFRADLDVDIWAAP